MTNSPTVMLRSFALLLTLSLAFCKYAQKTPAGTSTAPSTPTVMPTTLTPPPGDYASEWLQIDSLERQGLYKSALERTEALYTRAKTDHKGAQVIKTLLFRGKYTTFLEEDGFVKAVQGFEQEEKKAAEPERAVLQSLLGELYSTYLQNQRWRIQERTPIPDGEGGDILTWSAAQIEKRALDFYSASVEQETALRAVPVDYLRDITQPGINDSVTAQPLRPTLFDLLGHRALHYFADERSYLTEPAYKFYLDQPQAFDPAPDFVRAAFESRDSASGKWLAIRLFQQLIAAHLKDPDPSALIDADLLRLQFAQNNSVLDNKEDRYRQALEILHKTHYYHASDAEIVYFLAQSLVEQDGRQKPEDASLLKRAVTECEDVIRRHPGTFGAQQCSALLFDLRRPSLQLRTEAVTLPEQAVLLSLGFKNTSQVWVKVVPVPNDPDVLNQMDWELRLPYLNGIAAIQQRKWTINDPADYREHNTEISLDPLPVGRYYVLAATSEDFTTKGQIVSFSPLVCSNLAGVAWRNAGDTRFVVAHRQTGIPLAGVRGDLFEYRWDRNLGQNVRRFIKQVQSDREGILNPSASDNQGFDLRLSRDNDTLWLDEHYSNYRYDQPPRQRSVQFFTDRSMYRPGQTVYFKGIVLERDANDYPAIVPNLPVTVKFYDVNHQEKSQLQLRTNAFGTCNGAFSAPASGLTGQMSIEIDGLDGSAAFNVEEYKRPKFEVTFNPLEGAYRVNETVTVRGSAKNYAGSNVDGAQVAYRVVRQARYPWWDWWGWRHPRPSESMEIANGVTATAADGSFEVKFDLLPDRTIPKKDQPMFDFTVMADVTDINGETRSNQATVTAGYVALNVDFDLPHDIELDSLRSVGLNTTNTAGQFQAASGTITVQALADPGHMFVQRYWDNPDVLTLQEAAFRRDFPNYAWNDEDNPEKWSRRDAARLVPFNTADNKKADLHGGKMTTGYYLVTLQTKDAFGEAIEIKRVLRVWTASDRAYQFESPAGAVEKNAYEPGETARIWLGARGQERYLYFSLALRQGKAQAPHWVEANGAVSIDLPVEERDRGGIYLSAFTVKNNRFYNLNALGVNVPWSNKDLQITYETFRDKLLPGEKEEWRLKISGPKKEQIAAEMVAAMYDASLDQFLPHQWSGIQFPSYYSLLSFAGSGFRVAYGETRSELQTGTPQPASRNYRQIEWFGFPLYGGRYPGRLRMAARNQQAPMEMADGEAAAMAAPAPEVAKMAAPENNMELKVTEDTAYGVAGAPPSAGKSPVAPPPPPRRNLNETVFFFPELRTDADGNVVLKFTMNEALTRWKFLAFAHTKDLKWAVSEKSVVTQKDLMILTNPPRFLREGDEIEFAAKVSNLSKAPIGGSASLLLFDATSMQSVEQKFGLTKTTQVVRFTVQPGQSTPVSWRLKVPDGGIDGLSWQVFAEGNEFRDGEENTLPVLSNRMLVTETLPITVRGNQNKTVVFDNLKTQASNTLRTERYTVEFTSNPAWYAVQALPYLMEFPHECTEQIFSRFYANTLASSVTQKLPNLRRVYDRWKGTGAMKSNLSKNQELKSALLEETPWVLDAQNEEQQKQNIALLFDLNRMADEQERAVNMLQERQAQNGGWSWFPGGREDWYITQYIVAGFGHLEKLGAFSEQNDPRTAEMVHQAVLFCDSKLQEQYRQLEKAVQSGQAKWEDDHLDGLVIHYLYARSFTGLDPNFKIHAYYLDQAAKYWLGKGLYQEGLLALALQRAGRTADAQKIVASLRERAMVKEELGMYWPFDWGMYWYQLPVETQALMVEVFDEVAHDAKSVEELRIWLLKNKQTNRWESTKATAEAVYALLLHGDNWLTNTQPVQVSLGGKTLQPAEYEPGTGYFKQSWNGAEVRSDWGTIKVVNPNSNLVWGAAYWQYFEDLDKIQTFRKTPLTIVKQLYREENSPTGPKLIAIDAAATLHPGDKIKVRIEIRVDRAMEYVHLKDMRASGFEPTNVLSGYHWQDGLGYYESTKDLATHFFIDYLPRGTFVFEYPLVASQRGDFSNGITTIQCMYAPEFSSHSQGLRVKVE